ncbi:response regulator [Larkinella punicea]|uniref:Response regulator n=1 Tax=Larkinella punicea TaxID=2315727 RepID=A0A368JI16_9BACT|nr:response regulator [Larkinella punicea]
MWYFTSVNHLKNSLTGCVFIADDDEDDRFLLQFAFQELGFDSAPTFAIDGLDLLHRLLDSEVRPALIILDINMPRLDGFETLKVLRSKKPYQTTPIVMLTTSVQESDRQHARDLGASAYLIKPSTIEELKKMVFKLVSDWKLAPDC